jgi:hypothetical protein
MLVATLVRNLPVIRVPAGVVGGELGASSLSDFGITGCMRWQ